MISFHTTRCLKGWPILYTVPFTEQGPPFRRCEKARVLRLGKRGIVCTLRWDRRAEDAVQAAEWALQPRDVPIGRDGEEAEIGYRSLRRRGR